MCTSCLLLLLFLNFICGQETYFIKTTDSQVCPPNSVDACETWFHYVSNSHRYFLSGANFVFLPGTHYMNTTLTVKDISTLSMTALNDTSAALETGTNISCTSANVGMVFMNITSLCIDGVMITGCGRVMTPTVFNESISEYATTFLNFSVDISVAVFINHVIDLTLNNFGIHNSVGYGMMGVNLYGDTTITNSYFLTNNNITLSIPQCHGDRVQCKGGNLILLYTDTKDCPLYEIQHSLLIENSLFQDGVDFGYTYQPFFRRSTVITRNDVLLMGGSGVSILMMQSSYGLTVDITNCTMERNSGYTGANLYIDVWDFVDNSSVTLTDTKMIHGNTRKVFRDIIETSGSYDAASGYWYLYGNKPFGQYVPVCTPKQKHEVEVLRIERCQVSYNRASLNSGGIMYMWPRSFFSHPRHIILNNVSFDYNDGDATVINIYLAPIQYGWFYNVNVTNSTFRGNYYERKWNKEV